MSITDKRLTEIQARVEEATDGPWIHDVVLGGNRQSHAVKGLWRDEVGPEPVVLAHTGYGLGAPFHNASFMAHARDDVPDLLAEIYRLKNRVGVLQSENHKLSEALTTSRHREAAARLLPAKMDW